MTEIISAAIGALIVIIYNYLAEFRSIRKNYIRHQIDHFYGPLYAILLISTAAFKHSKDITDKSVQVYSKIEDDQKIEARQERDRREFSVALDIANRYGDEAVKYNESIFDIIRNNFSYIDDDDIEVINSFLQNYLRLKIEFLEKQQLPFQVATQFPDINVLRDEFVRKIMEKFEIKKTKLLEPSLFHICFHN